MRSARHRFDSRSPRNMASDSVKPACTDACINEKSGTFLPPPPLSPPRPLEAWPRSTDEARLSRRNRSSLTCSTYQVCHFRKALVRWAGGVGEMGGGRWLDRWGGRGREVLYSLQEKPHFVGQHTDSGVAGGRGQRVSSIEGRAAYDRKLYEGVMVGSTALEVGGRQRKEVSCCTVDFHCSYVYIFPCRHISPILVKGKTHRRRAWF